MDIDFFFIWLKLIFKLTLSTAEPCSTSVPGIVWLSRLDECWQNAVYVYPKNIPITLRTITYLTNHWQGVFFVFKVYFCCPSVAPKKLSYCIFNQILQSPNLDHKLFAMAAIFSRPSLVMQLLPHVQNHKRSIFGKHCVSCNWQSKQSP